MNEKNKLRVAELEKEHGAIAYAETPEGVLLAFKKPDQDSWEQYQEDINSGKRKGVCYRQLGMANRLEPANDDQLAAIYVLYPGLNSTIGNALADLATGGIELTVKKG